MCKEFLIKEMLYYSFRDLCGPPYLIHSLSNCLFSWLTGSETYVTQLKVDLVLIVFFLFLSVIQIKPLNQITLCSRTFSRCQCHIIRSTLICPLSPESMNKNKTSSLLDGNFIFHPSVVFFFSFILMVVFCLCCISCVNLLLVASESLRAHLTSCPFFCQIAQTWVSWLISVVFNLFWFSR